MNTSWSPGDFFFCSSALLCILDAQGTIIKVNPAWEQQLNVVSTDLEKSHFLNWVHPDDLSNSRQILQQLITQHHPITLANRWRDCAGHYHWLNWQINVISQNVQFYAVATDITPQKHAEKLLRDTEERFELAVQGSNHGLWDWNLITNEIYLSPRWKNILGYEDHEISNHLDEWCRFVHPDDFTQMWFTIEAYLDRQMSRYESTYRMRHKNGEYRWILARAAALWDPHQQPYRMVGTYVDITQRKKTEQALQENETLLSAIFEVTRVGLCITDEQGLFIRVNPAYCQLFHYQPEELIGQPFTMVLDTIHHQPALRMHQEFLNGNPKIEGSGEWTLRSKTGEYKKVGFTMALIIRPNGQRLRVTTVTDVTKQKQDAEERHRLFNLSLDMQSIIGFDLQFKEINLAWERTLGWTKAELLRRSPMDFVHKDDYENSRKTVQKLALGETVCGFENRYLCKNGSYKWLSWNVYPLVDQETMYIVTRDITERKLAEEEIHRQREFIRLVVDSVPNLIFIKDYFGNFIFANQALATLLGTTVDALINRLPIEQSHPLEQMEKLYSKREQEVIQLRKELILEESCYDLQGELHHFQITKKPFIQANGSTLVLSVGTDITARKQQEEALRLTAAIFESTADGILVTDLHNRIIQVNPAFTKITGYLPEEVHGKTTHSLSSGRHDHHFYTQMWNSIRQTGHWQGEIWNRKKTGEVYVAWLSISAITNDKQQIEQYVAILTDISRLQEDMENIRYLANYDSLTQLPNRLLFQDNLLQTQIWAHQHNQLFALLFVDLDGFKPVNDQLGHATGDQLLQEVAKRLRHCVRETDTVARLGGDEFTIILKNIRKSQDAGRVAADIVHCLQQPFSVGGHQVLISASIGITVYPRDSKEIDLLLKYADHAMYQAKEAGKGQFCFYHQSHS